MCVGVCRWVGVSVHLSKIFGVCVLGWVWVGVGVIVCDESVSADAKWKKGKCDHCNMGKRWTTNSNSFNP